VKTRPAHHPRFSPSGGLPRALLCPGSATIVPTLPHQDQSTPEAEEGTLLHERTAHGPLDGLTAEQAVLVARAQEFAASKHRPGAIFSGVEEVVDAVLDLGNGEADVELWGTVDFYEVFDDGTAIVIDYKFGRAEPQENFLAVQGLAYAVMLSHQFAFSTLERVDFYSYHPRLEVETHLEITNLEQGEETIVRIMNDADAYPGKFTPGLEACRYCPALAVCPAVARESLALVERNEQFPSDPDRFDELVDQLDLAEKWLNRAREECRQRIKAGQPSRKWTTETKKGRRSVVDPIGLWEAIEGSCGWRDFLLTATFPIAKVQQVSGMKPKAFYDAAGDTIQHGEDYIAVVRRKEDD
jgi:hypothetical protein